MATDYFPENEAFIAAHNLPSPSDTPYSTPLPAASRRSSRHGTPSPVPSSSPPPLPPDFYRTSEDVANDESISILDPRRFTPTLHASLVSEILSLRRDLDSKHRLVEELETSLQKARTEGDTLTQQLQQNSKETRSLKRQISQLETDTLAALEELAKDRDQTKEVNLDLKDKLEASQKKIRSQEDDSNRVHSLWARDKEIWDEEKRALERHVHVTESRLKLVLNEYAAQQAAFQDQPVDSEAEDNTKDSGLGNESETSSIRSMSRCGSMSRTGFHSRNMSNGSYRSFVRGYRSSILSEGYSKPNGISLADELKFDEDEEDMADLELDSDDFPENEMRARRALESRQSLYQDEKAKRVLGLTSEGKAALNNVTEDETAQSFDSSTARTSEVVSRSTMREDQVVSRSTMREDQVISRSTMREDQVISRSAAREEQVVSRTTLREEQAAVYFEPKPEYVDTGIQFSPPPSPTKSRSGTPKPQDGNTDIEANQARKRVSAPPTPHSPSPSPVPKPSIVMVSASVQTVEAPLSPPATPKVSLPPSPQLPPVPLPKVELTSNSTQTEPFEDLLQSVVLDMSHRSPPPTPIPIPSIAIHPPMSAPNSPGDCVLPPGTKNASSQTSFDTLYASRSVSVQTEIIRVDKRLIKLPPHLLPSAISSKPGTPEPVKQPKRKEPKSPIELMEISFRKGPILQMATEIPSSPPLSPSSEHTEDRYPGNNDNGVLARAREEVIRRPFRTSSLFAGFDGPSSDEEEDGEVDLSDGEEYRFLPAPVPKPPHRTLKHSGAFANPPTPVPEEKEVVSRGRVEDQSRNKGKAVASTRISPERPSRISKPIRMGSLTRQPNVRRSAMIQSGTTAHYQRSRSPSIGSIGSSNVSNRAPRPPFPVPTRSSSRRIPLSKSEGSQSPSPGVRGLYSHRRGQNSRGLVKRDSLRKVRSAAVIQRRQRSRSPPVPPLPMSPAFPTSPQLPPLPKDAVTSNTYIYSSSRFGHRSQPSSNTSYTGNASVANTNTSVANTSVGNASVGTDGHSFSQPTSVVDAIAATMVGEWMWKYVRKRKSFGVQESPQDMGKTAEDGSVNVTGNGARHKRWVWLSPYERAVMWSSKQPTSGSALMGKSGRKLTIQSVLDVKDDTPIPKSAGTQTLFNRSILILTPSRALKFTAVSKERHYLWLTALSFLAHSAQGAPELSIPPLPPQEPPDIPRHQPTLRRAAIRDSVRLAKEKALSPQQRGFGEQPIFETQHGESQFDRPVADSAEPPSIPRFAHGRKRSLTGPRMPPPSSFRTFSHSQVPSSTYSTGSSDVYGIPPSVPSSVYNPNSVITSCRTSEASSSARHNFFDAMGTVRMEAFVEPLHDDTAGARPRPGRRRGNSQRSDTNPAHRAGGVFDELYDNFDPFHGF